MTFGTNIKKMINYVYGDIEIDNDEIEKLNNALTVKGSNDEKLIQMKAINNLFKNLTFQLLTELNTLEREHGGKLRIRQPTELNLLNNAKMDLDNLFDLFNENKVIGINNLRLKHLINKMKI